jgi:hypothetical protein
MNGQPCVRDLRLTVRRVLEALATYPDREELLREYPGLPRGAAAALHRRGFDAGVTYSSGIDVRSTLPGRSAVEPADLAYCDRRPHDDSGRLR